MRDFYGTPVASGTYGGGSINIPVTAVPSPMPVGGWVAGAPPSTIEFQTYVVVRKGS